MPTARRPLKEVFLDALAVAPEARAAWLEGECGGDPQLRRQVELMLAAHDRPQSLIDSVARPADRPGPATKGFAAGPEQPGTVIGPYKLMEQIGEGGMGLVFVAEQQHPVRRKVALKIIKPGLDSAQVVARFEAERQALAMMDHQNIARVHDAGTTPGGRPYFVMELVHGVPITEYCDANKLTPRQRLELFVPVCHALQHAHQKGVIHRDIKPSNVLVTMYDDKPVPKVIDFGVAKAVDQRLTERTLYTQFGTLVGTFEYMSPEQAEMNAFGVDTRSDVYSLGVLLYELLTGSTPLERARLREAAFGEIVRLIKEEEPPRPSVRLSTSGTRLKVAAARQTDPVRLSRLVRGELDWVVMKCLEKDRTRRYETANGLARDVERYLRDEPVEARPPTFGYRLGKMARRHKRALATAALAGLLLLAAVGAVAASIGWQVRDREARRAKLTTQFELILEEVKSLESAQKWPEALAAARRAEALVAGGGGDAGLDRQVQEVLAELRLVERLEEIRLERAGEIEGESGFDWADRMYAAAFRDAGVDFDRLTEDEAAQHLQARGRVVLALAAGLDDWAVCRPSDPARSRKLRAVAQRIDPDPWRGQVREAMLGKDGKALEELAASADLIRQPMATRHLLGVALYLRAGQVERGTAVLREAQRQYPGDFWVNYSLGAMLREPASREEALGFYRAALALRPNSATAWNGVGLALQGKGQRAEAVVCFRRAIELSPNDSNPRHNLGNALRGEKKLEEAIASFRKAIELNPKSAESYISLGAALYDQRDPVGAAAAFQAAIRLKPGSASAHFNLGNARGAQEKWEQASESFRQAIKLDPNRALAHYQLGIVLLRLRERIEAIESLQRAVKIDPTLVRAHVQLGNVLKADRKPDEAIDSFKKAIEADPENAGAYREVGATLHYHQRKLDEAIPYYRRSIALDPKTALTHCDLGRALADQNKLDEAIDSFKTAIDCNRPNFAMPHHHLGLARYAQNKLNEAVACWQRAVAIDTEYAAVRRDLAWFLATAADPKMRDPKAAVIHAHKALELAPNQANNWSTLGVALLRNGDAKIAVEKLEKADQMWKGDHHHRFFLAMAYWQVGEKEKARTAYEQGVRWMDKNQPTNAELRRFRAEAETVLKVEEK